MKSDQPYNVLVSRVPGAGSPGMLTLAWPSGKSLSWSSNADASTGGSSLNVSLSAERAVSTGLFPLLHFWEALI